VAAPGLGPGQTDATHSLLETVPPNLSADNFNALRRGLHDLGYVEGTNFRIDYRSADGAGDRFPGLAAELVRQQVDIIVTGGTSAALAAKAIAPTWHSSYMQTAIWFWLPAFARLQMPGGGITARSIGYSP